MNLSFPNWHLFRIRSPDVFGLWDFIVSVENMYGVTIEETMKGLREGSSDEHEGYGDQKWALNMSLTLTFIKNMSFRVLVKSEFQFTCEHSIIIIIIYARSLLEFTMF